MRLQDVPLWAIYLLHFDAPVASQRHYVGRCPADRLQARMIEHTTGKSAKLTAVACQQGTTWALARVFYAIHHDHEQVVEQVKDVAGICPVCSGGDAIRLYQPTKKARSNETGRSNRVSISQTPINLGLSSGHEKRRTHVEHRPFPSVFRQQ